MQVGIDPEEALRGSVRKFGARFREVERLAEGRGWASLHGRADGELQALWAEAKQRVGSLPAA